jgi:ssDNA-binding Zn-finger/Zn-ribbon topoisomerase 1
VRFIKWSKIEAGPETDNREIKCRACGGPLVGREGKFVLKYFLLRKAIPSRRLPKAEADNATLIERVELATA